MTIVIINTIVTLDSTAGKNILIIKIDTFKIKINIWVKISTTKIKEAVWNLYKSMRRLIRRRI